MHKSLVHFTLFLIPIPANWSDFILCACSITIAVLYHPIIILSRLWPYLSLLVTFGAFVLWNGGVVLGMSPFAISILKFWALIFN